MTQSAASSRDSSPLPMLEGNRVPAPPDRDVARPVANLGNTCYMNAVLQALAHAPELCLAMDAEPHYSTCPIYAENSRKRRSSPSSSPLGIAQEEDEDPKPTRKSRRSQAAASKKSPTNLSNSDETGRQFCTLCEVERHLTRVHAQASTSKEKPVSPSTFVHGFINHVAPWFKLGVQEDSHEFLRLLIDAMQRSCKEARQSAQNPQDTPPPPSAIEEGQESPLNLKAQEDEKAEDSKSAEQAIKDKEYPFQLFRGTVESQVTCEHCEATSSTMDPIEDIGLEVTPINPDASYNLADVASAFQRFAKAEALDSGYKCEKCGKVGKATKQSRLASIPPILTLHLKRFRYGESKGSNSGAAPTRRSGRSSELDLLTGRSGSAKIEGHARFDAIIDLKPYLTPKLQAQHNNMLCRLFAVIVHAGKNSHSGHYISYVRNVAKNEWWKMDDARVTLASLQEVMNAEAYMLFYRVVEHPFAQHVRTESKKLEDAYKIQESESNSVKEEEEVDVAMEPSRQDESTAKQMQSSVASGKQDDATERMSTQPRRESELSRSGRSHNSRKRKAPEFTCGEDWARAKSNLPRTILHKFRDVEHVISDIVTFRSEFLQMITEQASRRSAQVGHGPSSGISPDDDFTDGSLHNVKRLLKKLLCALEGQQKNGGVPLFPKNSMPPSNAEKEPASTGRVANIVPHDDADVL